MAVSGSYLEFVLEQLTSSPRAIHPKRMFGGVGIYADERFVALIDDDRLYLKAGDGNRADFERENALAFRPYGEGGYSMSYYEVPLRVLEDRDELAGWIERSWEAAGTAKKRTGRKKGGAGRKK